MGGETTWRAWQPAAVLSPGESLDGGAHRLLPRVTESEWDTWLKVTEHARGHVGYVLMSVIYLLILILL